MQGKTLTAQQLGKAAGISTRRVYTYVESGILKPDQDSSDNQYNRGQIEFIRDKVRPATPATSRAGIRIPGEENLPTWTEVVEQIVSEPTWKEAVDAARTDEWISGNEGAANAMGIATVTFQKYFVDKQIIERKTRAMRFSEKTAGAFIRMYQDHQSGVTDKQLADRDDVPVSREWIRQNRTKLPHTQLGRHTRYREAAAVKRIHELLGGA